MRWGAAQFWEVATPIVRSAAFSRLLQITFLGILSPAYKKIPGFPITYRETSARASDRTRAHHSLAVAFLAGRMSVKLGLSRAAVQHAIAWGLLHDIATWPLSHTGEAAFASSTRTDTHNLRSMMILGSDRLSSSLSLYALLKTSNIDHGMLVALFDKRESGFKPDLALFHKLVHSTLTPDTLEGIYRCGNVFDIKVPAPKLFIEALEQDLLSGINLKRHHSGLAFDFWRSKARIYADYINKSRTVEFESRWSFAIRDRFARSQLNETLQLSERDIIDRVISSIGSKPKDVLRYKEPLLYSIAQDYKRRRSFNGSMPVDTLSKVFVKNQS